MKGVAWKTKSEEETESLGRQLGKRLMAGDVLLLRGEMGAGKTVLARGIARGLDIKGPIASPTFTLLNCHEGRFPLYHFDLYRLDGENAFFDAGLEDFVSGAAIAVVEWPERCEGAMPPCHLQVVLAYGKAEDERVITLLPMGGFREVSL